MIWWYRGTGPKNPNQSLSFSEIPFGIQTTWPPKPRITVTIVVETFLLKTKRNGEPSLAILPWWCRPWPNLIPVVLGRVTCFNLWNFRVTSRHVTIFTTPKGHNRCELPGLLKYLYVWKAMFKQYLQEGFLETFSASEVWFQSFFTRDVWPLKQPEAWSWPKNNVKGNQIFKKKHEEIYCCHH